MAEGKKCESCGLLDSILVRRHRIFTKNAPPVIRSLCKNCYYKITHGLSDSEPKKIQRILALNYIQKFILIIYECLFLFIGYFMQIIGELIEKSGIVLLEMDEQLGLEISLEDIANIQKLQDVFQSIEENKKCSLCGMDDSRLFEKHHTSGRNFSPNLKSLCKNCHYKITYKQNKIAPEKRSKNAKPIYLVIFMLISEGVLFNERGKELTYTGEELIKITDS